jgi:ribosomal protein S18 acetylase RimI-like enzyme
MMDLVRSRPAGHELEFPSLADLRELMGIASMKEATRLWVVEDRRLAGFAILELGETYAELSMNIAAGEDGETILPEMIVWAEEVFRERYDGQATGVQISVEESNTERTVLLERHGFTRQEWHTLLLERDLSEPIPTPVVPEGFSLRSLTSAEEPAWVALHQAAFGTQNMTLDWRQAMTRAPGYDPQLDLVAVTPDGRLAAYVFGSISREENEQSGRKIGYTDPVGTHPDYQRRGLCRALLLECMRRLREKGMEAARLGTGSWDTAMQRAAQSTGFRVLHKKLWLKKSFAYEPVE